MLEEVTEKIKSNYDKYPMFAALLFTEEHPFIVKALKDPDIYDALDRLTGPNLLFFTSMLFNGRYRYPSPPTGFFAEICPIWMEPRENMKLLPLFGISDSRNLPLLVVFSCGTNDSDLYWVTHRINGNNVTDVFNSIREAIDPIVCDISKNLYEPREKIFQKAKWSMRKLHAKEKLKELLGIIGLFRGATGM